MLTAQDVRVLDLNSAWHGVPPSLLMQNAGRRVADAALNRFHPRRVLVLCGPGNNGGDGAVAARLLRDAGVDVTVVYARGPESVGSGEARLALRTLQKARVPIRAYTDAKQLREAAASSDLVIDALLGVGVAGELRSPIRDMVKGANAGTTPMLSVDVPTGLGGRTQALPDVTVTLHGPKRGMTRANSGEIIVADIGIPSAAAEEVGPGDLAVHYPRNPLDSHKGQNGRVLVVAGGPYSGAPLLSSLAALRTGADLVRLYTPGKVAAAARAASHDLMVVEGVSAERFVPEDVGRVAPFLDQADVVLVGPGLGTHKETRAAIRDVLELTQKRRIALVLDADAHVVAGKNLRLLPRRPVLCTPHAREFKDLTGRALPKVAQRVGQAVRAQAQRLRVTLLLKGPTDWITDGLRLKPNRIHHPWMTVGGTGDVLAGCCAALVSKGLDPFHAAAAAAFLNGAAGLEAYRRRGWGSRASDLLENIPHVLREWVP